MFPDKKSPREEKIAPSLSLSSASMGGLHAVDVMSMQVCWHCALEEDGEIGRQHRSRRRRRVIVSENDTRSCCCLSLRRFRSFRLPRSRRACHLRDHFTSPRRDATVLRPLPVGAAYRLLWRLLVLGSSGNTRRNKKFFETAKMLLSLLIYLLYTTNYCCSDFLYRFNKVF